MGWRRSWLAAARKRVLARLPRSASSFFSRVSAVAASIWRSRSSREAPRLVGHVVDALGEHAQAAPAFDGHPGGEVALAEAGDGGGDALDRAGDAAAHPQGQGHAGDEHGDHHQEGVPEQVALFGAQGILGHLDEHRRAARCRWGVAIAVAEEGVLDVPPTPVTGSRKRWGGSSLPEGEDPGWRVR